MLVLSKPAASVKTVASIGTASRDFSTVAAWLASLPANLVTDGNSYTGQLYADSEFTAGAYFSGHTTDASHTITLTTGPGQSFRDKAGVRTTPLHYNASNGVGFKGSVYMELDDQNVTLSNFQLYMAANYNPPVAANTYALSLSNMIIESYNNRQNVGVANGAVLNLYNCLLSEDSGYWGNIYPFGSINAYYCTMVRPSDRAVGTATAVVSSYGACIFSSCAIFGWDILAGGNSSKTFNNCMTDITTGLPAGVTGGQVYANQFVGTTVAGLDMRSNAGANLLGAGAVDAVNGARDISNTPRPQGGGWDIGCWEQ